MVDVTGTTKYTYTPAGQLATEDGPFADDTMTNIYSNRLRVRLSLKQPVGLWTNGFGYDASRRISSASSLAGTFTYLYPAGLASELPVRLSLPNGAYVTNRYDGNARLLGTWLKNSGNSILDAYEYAYNPASQRTNLTRADASGVAYVYDRLGQLKVANSTVNSEDQGYTYDSAWNLNYRTNNGSLESFSVDVKNQLSSQPAGGCAYGANGNLTNNAGWLYVYDDENRLVSWSQGAPSLGAKGAAFVYDGQGRLRSRSDYEGDGSQWVLQGVANYIYDGMRVIQERDAGNAPAVAYTRGKDLSGTLEGAGGIGGLLARSGPCNPDLTYWLTNNSGYCIHDLAIWDDYGTYVSGASVDTGETGQFSFTDVAGRTYHVYGLSCDEYYIQIFSDYFVGSLDTRQVYFVGEEGNSVTESGSPLCEGVDPWAHDYYFADANGNVTMLIDAGQNVVASYRYDPFGNTVNQSGSLADANVYRFSSKEFHSASGLYYYGYRFYDPDSQRWLNRDPWGEGGFEAIRKPRTIPMYDGPNAYSYVRNSPVGSVDPLGLAI